MNPELELEEKTFCFSCHLINKEDGEEYGDGFIEQRTFDTKEELETYLIQELQKSLISYVNDSGIFTGTRKRKRDSCFEFNQDGEVVALNPEYTTNSKRVRSLYNKYLTKGDLKGYRLHLLIGENQ